MQGFRPFRAYAARTAPSKNGDSQGVKADFLALDYAYNGLGGPELQ